MNKRLTSVAFCLLLLASYNVVPTGAQAAEKSLITSYDTPHFTVDYGGVYKFTRNFRDETETAYLKKVGDELEAIRTQYEQWGLKTPDHQLVYLYPIVHGWDYLVGTGTLSSIRPEVYGEAAKLRGQMLVGVYNTNNSLLPFDELKLTLAHEYFHRVQMQYYRLVGPAKFLREGTANLMEILVYPDKAARSIPLNNNMTPVKFATVSLSSQGDETAAFFLYMTDKYTSRIISSIFEAYSSPMTATAVGAIEKGIRAHGAKSDLSSLFFDFAEEFYASDPPSNKFYAQFRQDVTRNNVTTKIIEKEKLGTVDDKMVVFDQEPLTARYRIFSRQNGARARVSLTQAGGGISVRLYTIEKDKAAYVGMLHSGNMGIVEMEIGMGKRIGALVTNMGSSAGKVTLKMEFKDTTYPGFRYDDARKISPEFKDLSSPNGVWQQITPAVYGTKEDSYLCKYASVTSYTNLGAVKPYFDRLVTRAKDEQYVKHEWMTSWKNDRAEPKIIDRCRFGDKEYVKDLSFCLMYEIYSGKGREETRAETKWEAGCIYRDKFLIEIGGSVRKFGYDARSLYTEMMQKAKDLIDLRYPLDE